MHITFNTGRLYTHRGQIITAKYDSESGTVWFNDHSRMVSGCFPVIADMSAVWSRNPESFARAVVRRYDNGGTHEYGTSADWRAARDLRESADVLNFRL